MFNQAEIKEILPHRSPILLVDQVYQLIPENSIEAGIFLEPSWDIFQGHFPGQPVLPGIYITECLAQTASILLLTIPGNQGKLPLLSCVSKMRYLRLAVPSDTLVLNAELVTNGGNDVYDCKVTAYLKDETAASGLITLTLK
ncbi:hotdog family protein [Anaeromicropila populeti]|uniref:3-hydroxyacyl-[acyl-carrier-protein] dehydratase n=1 Tax=Anaeromicropila populeti TaxID=37658 RepID=A0A1I6J0C6_9FIRM|nr:beta-hydroxyacyl-ACP dehydratase [Anaeromicropila populeti]SFR72436.1 3-hydroxyacyl-[acyl-carrier-protein] dehydratase [Anaeromicropila populeti]